jgi:hypothetical protein
VYTGNQPLTSATTIITNDVNSRVGALVANSSKYGTQLAAQWSATSPGARTSGTSQNNSNLAVYAGVGIGLLSKIPNLNLGSLLSGTTPGLPSVKTAMDALGKASKFATTAASTLQSGLSNSLGSLTAGLPSLGSLTAGLPNLNNLSISSLLGGTGDSLVASVQKAAGFSNTVNRATVDTAMSKIFGSSKIPLPSLGPNIPDSATIKAALDIGKAESILKDLKGQGTALLNQAQGLAGQAQGLANQVQGQANNLLGQARTVASQIT